MATTTALGYEDLPRLFERMSGDEKHDPELTLDPRRALGPLRPRPRGRRPLSPLQGARADGVLRGARGQGLLPRGVAGRLRLVRLAARPPPGPRAGSGRRDRERLARPRPADRRRRRARRPARLLPGRRRRTGRGEQLGGDPVRGPDRPRAADRGRARQLDRHPRLAGRDRGEVPARGLDGRAASTGATTTRWSAPFAPAARAGRTRWSPRCGDEDAVLRPGSARARGRPEGRGGARGHRRRLPPQSRADLQRRHPRAADDRRHGRSRAGGLPPDRALVCAVPRRAPVRAGQARPRPPGSRRRPRLDRRLLRRLDRPGARTRPPRTSR